MPDMDVRKQALELEQQMRLLQDELRSPLEVGGTAAPKLPVEEGRRLKRVVDDFRLFLWAYIDTWSENRSDMAATVQRIRLQAVADMMNVLRSELAGKGIPQSPEGRAVRKAFQDFSWLL